MCDVTLRYMAPQQMGLAREDLPRSAWPSPRTQLPPFHDGFTDYLRAVAPGVYVGWVCDARQAGRGGLGSGGLGQACRWGCARVASHVCCWDQDLRLALPLRCDVASYPDNYLPCLPCLSPACLQAGLPYCQHGGQRAAVLHDGTAAHGLPAMS